MLDIEVQKAKAERVRRNRNTLIGVVAGIAVIAVFLFVSAKAPSIATNSGDEGSQSDVAVSPAIKEVQTNPQEANPLEAEPIDTSYAKPDFLTALDRLESEVIPSLDAYPRLNNSAQLQSDIQDARERAAILAAKNDYASALNQVTSIEQSIESEKKKEQQSFTGLLKDLEQRWQEKQISFAQNLLDEMNKIFPDHPDTARYKGLLSDWPKVSALTDQISVAKAEGDEETEASLLGALAELNHDIPNVESRIATLNESIKQRLERNTIKSLQKAIDQKNTAKADKYLAELRRQGVEPSKVSHLVSDLANVKRQQSLKHLFNRVDKALSRDEWHQAYQLLQAKRQTLGTNDNFQTRHAFVEQIHVLTSAVKDYLDHPSRLANKRVQNEVKQLLENAQAKLPLSKTLKRNATKLTELLKAYRTKVAVTVTSDGQTYVQVKSVGIVGVVSSKTIQLLPGNYIFEGKRKGYVTKRVKVDLRPATPLSVKIVADEQI